MKKLKSVLFSLILSVFGVFAIFGLAGCGDINLATVKESFEGLQKAYEEHTDVFSFAEADSSSYLTVNYGTIVDGYVQDERAEYAQLKSIYNVVLSISNSYIDNNKAFVINYPNELSSDSKSALNSLNNSINDYTKEIENFVLAREALINHFDTFHDQLAEADHLAVLRNFKKSYGALVTKNVTLAMNLANAVEKTEIFDLLRVADTTANDTKIMREYIRARLLPIFSEFQIVELENKLYWGGQKSTDTKARIDQLLTALENQFDFYELNFAPAGEPRQWNSEKMNELLDMVEMFDIEIEDYMNALHNFGLSKLAVENDLDLEKYTKINKFAEIYLEKLEQFVEISLPNFMNNVLEYV